MFAALAAAPGLEAVDVSQQDILTFLNQLLGRLSPAAEGSTVATSTTFPQQVMPVTGSGPASASLRLHPRVDVYHPLGEAHSDKQVLDALALYRRLFKDSYLQVEEVVASGDKALAIGTQHVTSYLAGAHTLLPDLLQEQLGSMLPKVTDGKVPTAVQLSIGKDDTGNPVVTRMTITFNLLAALLPHLELQPWQQEQAEKLKPLIIDALLATGGLSAVVEDVGAVTGAAWRTVSTMVSTTLGSAAAAVRGSLGLASSSVGVATSLVTGHQDHDDE